MSLTKLLLSVESGICLCLVIFGSKEKKIKSKLQLGFFKKLISEECANNSQHKLLSLPSSFLSRIERDKLSTASRILTISGLKVQCYLILEDIGPELSRTVIVSTKLDTKIPQFACPSDVEDFLSPPASTLDGTILGESPFSQQCFLKELVLEKIQLPVILVSSLAETFLSKLVKLVLKDEDIPQLEGSESSVQVPGYSITTPWTSL